MLLVDTMILLIKTQPVDYRVPLGSLLESSNEQIEDILAEHHPYYYTVKNVVRYE